MPAGWHVRKPRRDASARDPLSKHNGDILERSVPNIEAVVQQVLSESVAQSLDTALLDATAGDATRPAGLRNGISATAASSTTPDSEAMFDDLTALAAAVAPVASGSPIVFVAAERKTLATMSKREPQVVRLASLPKGGNAGESRAN